MHFLSRLICNFKIARVNQVRFSVRFVAAISQGFRACLKLDAIMLRQKLHRVAATKIACVQKGLYGKGAIKQLSERCKLFPTVSPKQETIIWPLFKAFANKLTRPD